jgi:hypothetical protein
VPSTRRTQKHQLRFPNYLRDPEGRWLATSAAEGLCAAISPSSPNASRSWKKTGRPPRAPPTTSSCSAPWPPAVHRTTRHLHATLQEARESAPDDRDLINLRDQAGELERAVELLHGDAKNGLDFTMRFGVAYLVRGSSN